MKKSRQTSSGQKSSQKKKQSSLTKQKLVDFLIKTAEVQRKLEIVKEMLAQEEVFTPASLFYRLDTARKGYISEKDVQNFLRDQKVQFKGSELKMLFGRINAVKSEEAVRIREFQNFILPNQNPKLRYYTVRRPVIIPVPHEPLDQKIEWITTKLFSEIVTQYSKQLSSQDRLSDIHQALLSSFDFDANQIFNSLSRNGQFITGQDIAAFFGQFGKDISTEEIGCLLKVVDKKGEGQVYLDDFKSYMATLGLKKAHDIFDQLSPIPALKDNQEKKVVKDRDATLKERYRDNKSYVQGMDQDGHHILGYSKYTADRSKSPGWLSSSRKVRG